MEEAEAVLGVAVEGEVEVEVEDGAHLEAEEEDAVRHEAGRVEVKVVQELRAERMWDELNVLWMLANNSTGRS